MQDYTKYKRGSEWRRWDIHLHTPETKKNDQFEGSNVEEKWQKYIDTINCSTDDVVVIGITDYLSIENYFKFKKFASENKITKNFELIIPNIELRVIPVTKSSTPINIHCLFNPLIDTEIESRFLSKLEISYGDSTFSAHKSELARLGKSIPGNSNLHEDEAYKKGLEQYVISIDSLRKIFEKDEKLRENTIIIVSNSSKDGVSGIRSHADYFTETGDSQLDITRWNIYQFSDAIFSSNPKDILYFLGDGPDSKEVVIEKCKTLMPCFHGCDAHSNEKLFNPDENRYCWVKADPTFEGFKQTLYEPEDRVKIQSHKPDIKTDRFIISEIQFIDDGPLFSNQSILLNENLNAIIGGKSSGKSLLMHCMAKAIDPEQVDRSAKRLKFEGYKFENGFNFEVTWKNGDKNLLNDSYNKHNKVTYIPQLYINHLVEKDNKEDLNKLIENILIQDATFKDFHQQKRVLINKLTEQIETEIIRYFQIRSQGLKQQELLKEIGTSSSLEKSIATIQAQIDEGRKQSNFSTEEYELYTQLTTHLNLFEHELAIIEEKENATQSILRELDDVKKNLFGLEDPDDLFSIKGTLFTIVDGLTDKYEDLVSLVNKISEGYDSFLSNTRLEINNLNLQSQKQEKLASIGENRQKLMPFQSKINGQQHLLTLTESLEKEKAKLTQAWAIEKQIENSKTDYTASRTRMVNLTKQRLKEYLEIVERINATKSNIGADVTLHCTLQYLTEDFKLFEQANKASNAESNILYSLIDQNLVKYEKIIEFIEKPLRVVDNQLIIDQNQKITLRGKVSLEDVLRGLTKDCLTFDYTVTYKGDNLLNMSPGKKGTVLLILFLQISSSEYPIFIDQPEDNLDNRTIYELLCKIIKQKKKERQIIIVSHNANLVVTTDAENVIVANQRGEDNDMEKNQPRFQYVNGSLEHSFLKNKNIKSELHCQGIREHVCDILEGGNEAFKQRERKYSIK